MARKTEEKIRETRINIPDKPDTDISNLRTRIEKLKKHLEKNKHDYKTKRTLLIKGAKLKKLEQYRKE